MTQVQRRPLHFLRNIDPRARTEEGEGETGKEGRERKRTSLFSILTACRLSRMLENVANFFFFFFFFEKETRQLSLAHTGNVAETRSTFPKLFYARPFYAKRRRNASSSSALTTRPRIAIDAQKTQASSRYLMTTATIDSTLPRGILDIRSAGFNRGLVYRALVTAGRPKVRNGERRKHVDARMCARARALRSVWRGSWRKSSGDVNPCTHGPLIADVVKRIAVDTT